jgi:thermolysin
MSVFSRLAFTGLCAALFVLSVTAQTRPQSRVVEIDGLDPVTLRQWDGWIRSTERAGALRIRQRQADFMLAGREHERLDQYHDGVRIFGAGVTRQWRAGQVESVFGRVYESLNLSVSPTLTADAAIRRYGCLRTIGRAELVVVVSAEQGALAWHVACARAGSVARVFIDAHDGSLLRRINALQTQAAIGEGRGVYRDRKKMSVTQTGSQFSADDGLRPPQLWTLDLRGNLRRAIDLLLDDEVIRPSDLATDGDNVWEDGAVVDAHTYIGWTYDYLFKRFGRRGLDDRDTPILTIVHPVTQSDAVDLDDDDLFTFATNAFWCGVCGPEGVGMMLFGDGLPSDYVLGDPAQFVTFLAGSLDIAAHELAHGLTDYTSALIYEGESGALNEAFSDIIGTSVEFFFQPPGNAVRQADYKIGEDAFLAALPGSADGLRSMAVPTAFGDPDHYSLRYRGTADEGGVHINSAIVNHAFYLAIEGGTHRYSGVTVAGVGADNRVQIERVFFRAFTMFLPPNATFSIARAATIQAARDLYGGGSAAERAVIGAWTAVGVE